MKLSIGQAWDEAKAIFRADGRAILAVSLALTVLPGAILETVSPSNLRTDSTPWYIALLGLIAALLSLTGQLAVSRIALGPSTTVGEALTHSFRRLPSLFGALVLLVLPFTVLIAIFSLRAGPTLDPANVPASVAVAVMLISLGALYVLIRMLFLTALAADRPIGPIALIKEGWRLSRGRFLKLLGLILLLMLVAVLLVGALGGALSAVVILAFGEIVAGSLSAALVALIQQTLAAAVSVLFVVVVCRLYRQAESGTPAVSVPHAGGE
nr:hypothetical protein [uncultured Sphingomonas sp.]